MNGGRRPTRGKGRKPNKPRRRKQFGSDPQNKAPNVHVPHFHRQSDLISETQSPSTLADGSAAEAAERSRRSRRRMDICTHPSPPLHSPPHPPRLGDLGDPVAYDEHCQRVSRPRGAIAGEARIGACGVPSEGGECTPRRAQWRRACIPRTHQRVRVIITHFAKGAAKSSSG